MSAPMLTGKTAMVTGAGGGIRRAICLAFASAGAEVACLGIDLAAAEKTAGASGNEAIAQHCDVSSETETRDAAAATISKFKAVHFLVNAAATDDRNGTILDITAEEGSPLVVVNVTGAFLVSRAVLPSMIAAGGAALFTSLLSWAVSPPRTVPLIAPRKEHLSSSLRPWRSTMPDRISGSTRCPRGESRPAAYSCGMATWHGHDGRPDRSIGSIDSVNLRKSPRPPYFWLATPQAL